MISHHYGRIYTLNDLRDISDITRDGVSLFSLSEAAKSIGFDAIGAKLSYEQLQHEVSLPCIIHWNQNHFVVVYKINGNNVWLADPGSQKQKISKHDFIRSWKSNEDDKEGFVLILEPTEKFYKNPPLKTSEKNIGSVNYLYSYIKPYKSSLVQLLFGLFLGSIIQLCLPFLTQAIVDKGISNNDIEFIYIILAGQLVLFLGRSSIEIIRQWILLHVGARINISIVSDFLAKMMRLPLNFFDTRVKGDWLQRVEDHSRIEDFLNTSSLRILFSIFNFFVFGLVLALYHIPIFLVFVLGSLFYFMFLLLFLDKRRILDIRRFDCGSMNRNLLIQLIDGMTEIKLNGAEKVKRLEWEEKQVELYRISVETTKIQQYQESGGLFLNELKNIVVSFMAATSVIHGEITLGMMLAIQFIIGQLNGPINESIIFIRQWQDAKLSLNRIQELHSFRDEEESDKINQGEILKKKDIQISNLSFFYSGMHSAPALRNLNFTIPTGKITALVGASGSGKTTLMKVLLKMYEQSEGSVMVGSHEIGQLGHSYWRSKCGVVMQDGFIFSRSIEDNVALGDENPNIDKVKEACRIANIQEFIEKLPMSYSTKIGFEGMGLSQGQKQRLLIARAVYKNPEFLFFDEATSALDTVNEKVIMENLNEFFVGRTVVVIAHRLSTVRNADQILVIDKGELIEQGDHASLVEARGSYFDLVRNQLELEVT